MAPSSFAAGTENFVDVNSIPLAAIDRIEVLATGASAIYGADAVAGVINYILKKDFEDVEIHASFEDSTAGTDESKKNLNLVWGGNVGEGNLTLFADLYDKNAFSATDREFTAEPLIVANYSYLPSLPFPNVYYNSSRDGNELANPDGPYPTTIIELGEEICAYYDNQHVLLDSELESISVGAIYSLEFGDILWNRDFFFSRSESIALSRPAPIATTVGDGSSSAFIPFTPISSLDIYTEEQLLAWQGFSSPFDIVWDDPFDTQAGRTLFGFRYDARFEDPRTIENETKSFRLVSSLTGEFDNGWQWETGITFSESKSEQVAIEGVYNRYKFTAAAHGELCSDGSIASYDADNDALNCSAGTLLPTFNPFLIGDADNDAILNVAQEMPTRSGKSTVFGIDAKFNGELMEFGDDYIRAAFGIEYRQEDLEDIPSDNSRANFDNDFIVDVMGFGSSLAEADRTQYDAFAEFYIPVADNIDVQVAGRYDHYDDFDGTFNPKFSFSYRPTDELILLGSVASSFRAPSLTQAGVELRTTTSTFDCAANALVSKFYCGEESFEASQNTLELGNPVLQAEESNSISIGVAFSPTDDTTITVDYWSFEHERVIDTNLTGVMARALTDSSLRHCGTLEPGSLGISFDQLLCDYADSQGVDFLSLSIDQMTSLLESWNASGIPCDDGFTLFTDHTILLENTGTQEVEGIDIDIAQDFDLWGGLLSIDADWTHYISFERNKPGSDEVEELIGTYRYPKNIANLSLFWGNDDYAGGISIRYTDSYEDDIEGLRTRAVNELIDTGVIVDLETGRDVSSWTTVDANFAMYFKDSTLSFNVDNIFDRDPPVVYGSSWGIDTINHNTYGTTFKVAYTYFF